MFKKAFPLSIYTILGLIMILGSAFGQGEPSAKPKLIEFFSPSCHRCIEVKSSVLPEIEEEFLGKITIEYRDLTDIENYKLLLGLKDKYMSDVEISLPMFFLAGTFVNGKGDIKNNLRELISGELKTAGEYQGAISIDLAEKFKNFHPLVIASAGLADGINPCAFTVIVFFMSFLALQGYRKRALIVIGLTFIFAVFLTYLLLGLGIFNFLYTLKGFWIIIKIVNIGIGVFSIVLGALSLLDFLKFRKTGKTEGLFLQLPGAVKRRIQAVIGLYYRKPQEKPGHTVKPRAYKLFLSALITGFLVSLLEAVCTGQMYLPTISFVLKTTNLKFQALGYLLLYNIMFVLPLFVIFCFALFGATSEDFSKFLKKNLSLIKVVMAVIFFGFGIFLIWRA